MGVKFTYSLTLYALNPMTHFYGNRTKGGMVPPKYFFLTKFMKKKIAWALLRSAQAPVLDYWCNTCLSWVQEGDRHGEGCGRSFQVERPEELGQIALPLCPKGSDGVAVNQHCYSHKYPRKICSHRRNACLGSGLHTSQPMVTWSFCYRFVTG